ncbi:MAG: hypothetical protein DWG76_07475 [Chloroflexi bacterium]|nr:hypothetical protein [Chloroflexota bacterium]
MVAPVTYIQSRTTIRRRRLLDAEGNVLVKVGDLVSSADTVAQAATSTRHIMLDAARALNVPENRVAGLMQRQIGEMVEKGAIIAGRRAVGARLLRAPENGRVVAFSGGQVLLQVDDESTKLPARLAGKIVDVEPGRGVILQYSGAWLQGVWGNHRYGDGILQLLAKRPDHVLTADAIDMSMRGAILVAGHCNQLQALELAGQVPIRGLILSSLATRLWPAARKLEYPILLTEGFGRLPMNQVAHQLLSDLNGEAATLNAQPTDPFEDLRPEVLIPLSDAGTPPLPTEAENFRLGQTVRILRAPHAGEIGEITALLPGSTLFPSGLRAKAAEIALSKRGHALVPLANLEVLG